MKITIFFNKGVIICSIVLLVFSLVLFIAIGCTSNDLTTFLVMAAVLLFWFLFGLVLTNWRIEIYKDKFIKCTLFSKKEYKFDKITMLPEVMVSRVFDLDGKELFRIDNFNDTNDSVYNAYCDFVRKNKIEIDYKNISTIKFSFATKGFSIFWLIISIILFALIAVIYFVYGINSLLEDKIMCIVALALGLICLILSIWGFLKYYNYSIEIKKEDNSLIITNMYKIKKVYSLDECTYEYTGILVKLYVNGKKIKTYSYYFMSNFYPLFSVLKEASKK